jgi:hypothetical protein
MTVLQKSVGDLITAWERMERMHLYPPFAIEWAIKKPGQDKALLGVTFRNSNGEYVSEVWELS